jgi:hypothetical protein
MILLFSMFVLTACASVPFSSLPQLLRIDFMTTDFSRMRLALVAPADLQILEPPSYIVFITKFDSKPEKTEEHPLQTVTAARDVASISFETPNGSSRYIFSLSPEATTRLESIRTEARERKKRGEKGSLSIELRGNYCLRNKLPSGPVLTSTYVLTSETQTWVPLLRNFNMRSEKRTVDELANMKPCDQ